MSEIATSIRHHAMTAFGRVASEIAGVEYLVRAADLTGVRDPSAETAPMLWCLPLADPGPSVWFRASRELADQFQAWAAGSSPQAENGEEPGRVVWRNLMERTGVELALSLITDFRNEVESGSGSEVAVAPPGLEWHDFVLQQEKWPQPGDEPPRYSFSVALAGELTKFRRNSEGQSGSRLADRYGNLDLLLDVALPVSVSFGRASLEIREVLDLNAGSIVQLNRFLADPVDVTVNGRLIARGEVVVVDGNYGVRVSQLASREDRLQSGLSLPSRNEAKI